ncbi:MAG: zinc metallopeptidase [Butyricicoccus pullicaecorum]|jgi:Zn-dependent membrane protease YugP|nr:zinc metallopeptidase [Butyricicoccus pullicaecorum]
MPYYYGFDYYYLVLVLPCVFFAMWAQFKVKSTFDRYSRVYSRRNMTGAQAAAAVLRAGGITNVRIERVSGHLSDHFDPRDNVIRLSDSVYSSTSVASIGVAAHEAGHAVQYAVGYAPMKLRAAIIPATNIGSMLSMPLILLGLVFNFGAIITIGIAFFGLSTVFQLVTLPVELNASNRALAAIEQGGLLYDDEYPMAKKTLWAAAMTYVAALAVSLAQLLRLILIFGGRGRDDD